MTVTCVWSWVISGWLVGLSLLALRARRYSVAKAWRWLALMLAAPWVGVILYLLLGENPLGRRRVVRYRQVIEGSDAGDVVSALEAHVARPLLDNAQVGIEFLAQGGGALPAIGGNEGELIVDSEQIVRQLVQDIGEAEHNVNLVFYIFRDDQTGRRIADALIEAAQRGVACRLIADAVGSHPMLAGLGSKLRRRGVQVCAALPINPLRRRLARIDLRNHRKVAVIDGRIGYLGSWNVADPNYGPGGTDSYRDIMVRLKGPAVLQLQLLCLEDWIFETGESLRNQGLFPEPRVAGRAVMQTVPSGPMYPSTPVRDVTVAAIHQARHNVALTTPYLIPDEALMLSLRLAVQRDVRVDVIVPPKSDSRLVDAAGRSYLRDLVGADVRVHLYQLGTLHAKILTVDQSIGMIGSANFDVRSFRLNVEANLLIYSHELITALREAQQRYMRDSRPLDRQALRDQSWLKHVGEDFARLLSPLI